MSDIDWLKEEEEEFFFKGIDDDTLIDDPEEAWFAIFENTPEKYLDILFNLPDEELENFKDKTYGELRSWLKVRIRKEKLKNIE